MTYSAQLHLYLVPASEWDDQQNPVEDISPFIRDALAIERRIRKGTAINNLPNERRRYQLCCNRIQEAVFRQRSCYQSEILGEEYFEILHQFNKMLPDEITKNRISACFFPPDTVKSQIDALSIMAKRAGCTETKSVIARLAFFQTALSQKAGVVEIPDYFTSTDKAATAVRSEMHLEDSLNSFTGTEDWNPEDITDLSAILRARIEKALSTGCEVNFSNQPHFIIADLLNEFVYKRFPDDQAGTIRVVYMDGSEAEAFQLRCLEQLPDSDLPTGLPLLKASLISMRHLEMDEHVDFSWFRNRKVSSLSCYRDADAYCTKETMTLLRSQEEPLALHLYQTGLESAVVGFYRGLVQELLLRRELGNSSPLQVTPLYFDRKSGRYLSGRIWS